MALKNYIVPLGRGSRFKITIVKKKRRAQKSIDDQAIAGKQKQGLMPVSLSKPQYVPFEEEKGGNIRFFDMARYKQSGNYIDIPDLHRALNIQNENEFSVPFADYQWMVNKALAVSNDKVWADTYEPILKENLNFYQMRATLDGNQYSNIQPFTDAFGWVDNEKYSIKKMIEDSPGVGNPTKFGLSGTSSFIGFETLPRTPEQGKMFKITEEFNYSAPEVEVNLMTKDTDIFLMPAFGLFSRFHVDISVGSRISYLMPMRRQEFLKPLDSVFTYLNQEYNRVNLFTRGDFSGINMMTEQQFNDFDNYIMTLPVSYNTFGGPHNSHYTAWTPRGEIPSGILTAVLIQGSKKYYCWTYNPENITYYYSPRDRVSFWTSLIVEE